MQRRRRCGCVDVRHRAVKGLFLGALVHCQQCKKEQFVFLSCFGGGEGGSCEHQAVSVYPCRAPG